MPKDYELLKPAQVASHYHELGMNCDKVIRYELKQRGLSTPKQFLGDHIFNLMSVHLWIKAQPQLVDIYEREQKTRQIEKRPHGISAKAWKMFNQFLFAEAYLKAKQGCLMASKDAKKSKGFAIWADVVHDSNAFDLWRISPALIKRWKDSTLSADEIKRLNPYEHKAYIHKLQDDEKNRHTQRVVHHKHTVDRLQTRRLQIIQNILDSRPFYFSASVLAKSVKPEFILAHLTSDQKRYIEERANHEIKADA